MNVNIQNIYENNPHYRLIDVQLVTGNEIQQKLTYRDAHCIIWRVAQVALAALVTLVTFCISLCFLKGRQLWTNALNRFRDHIVFEKVISTFAIPPETNQTNGLKTEAVKYPLTPVHTTLTNSVQNAFNSQPVPISPVMPVVNQANNSALLQLKKDEILSDNPDWKTTVNDWEGISLSDQVWILQVFELRKLEVKLILLDSIMLSNNGSIVDNSNISKMLEQRKDIEACLAVVDELLLSSKGLKKCPDAICLLPNLKILNLIDNKLTTPPDVSKNPALIYLGLSLNQLTIPPNVSNNLALSHLVISYNQLTTSPDVSKNLALETLDISGNKLAMAPDVSKNSALKNFAVSENKLTEPPDVSKNLILKELFLYENLIPISPDISKNLVLTVFNIEKNLLTIAPDISENKNLHDLFLKNNKLTEAPDISNNKYLRKLDLTDNPLSVACKNQLKQLKKTFSGLMF